MKFNIMGIILMMIAIVLGSMVGGLVSGFLPIGGGLIGSLVVGAIIYVIYAFLTGTRIQLWSAVIFAILVWIAQMISSTISGAVGLGGGLIGTAFTAIVLSFLWGYFGKGKRR